MDIRRLLLWVLGLELAEFLLDRPVASGQVCQSLRVCSPWISAFPRHIAHTFAGSSGVAF